MRSEISIIITLALKQNCLSSKLLLIQLL